jgi:hypothetical protein
MSNFGVCCSTAVLDISGGSTTTTWYLPLFNYTGSLYISQLDVSGSLIGSGVWSNVSAKQYTTNYYTYSYSDSMDISYNSSATGYGFMFTGVNSPNYSLYVTFMGVIQRTYSFTFISTNPYDPQSTQSAESIAATTMTNNRHSSLNI